MENKVEAVLAGVALSLVVALVALMSWGITRNNMRDDAIANGAAHWVVVDGNTAFIWGPGE